MAEYCMITALLALLGLGIYVRSRGGLESIWRMDDQVAAPAGHTSSAGATAFQSGGSR